VARDDLGEGERLKSLGPVGISLGDPVPRIGLSAVSSAFFCSTTFLATVVSASVFTSGSGLGGNSCFMLGSDFASACVAGLGILVS